MSIPPFSDATSVRDMTSREIVRFLNRERLIIIRGWRSRKVQECEPSGGTWDESAEQWAVRRVYGIVRQLKKADRLSELEVYCDKISDRPGRLQATVDQPFKNALYAFLGIAKGSDRLVPMTRQRRFLIGEALNYADRHDVEARYVICFIKHAGLRDIPRKLAEGYVEPGFSAAR